MLFFRPRVDQDIVDKYNHEFIKIWFAYAVHQIHKDRWCIRQPEWHHKKLGALATGAAPGTKSIRNSTYRCGGSPGRSSGKTSGNSFTTGISSSFGSSSFLSTTCARKATHPFLKHFYAFMQLMIRRGASRFSPCTMRVSSFAKGMRMIFS
ncbi:hypothetical protein Hanom_Chr07g00589241 [Helianthus anomalus]